MSFSDIAIILATISGPILAVQAQMFLERRRAAAGRRLNVFRTLLASRGARLSAPHVEALNLIDVEFYTPARRFLRQNPKLRRVRSAWKAYYDHLATPLPADKSEEAVYFSQRNELFTDLLYEMAMAVGYAELDKAEIRKLSYVPMAHESIEVENTMIRRGFAEVLAGRAALPMRVVEFPFAVTPPPALADAPVPDQPEQHTGALAPAAAPHPALPAPAPTH